MKTKGYIFAGLTFVALLSLTAAMFSLSFMDQERNNKNISALKAQYMAESMIDITQSLVKSQIESMQLIVTYIINRQTDDAGNEITGGAARILMDSSSIYQDGSAAEFAGICAETENLIHSENLDAKEISCEVHILNKAAYEMKLHVMDKNGLLSDLDEYMEGELLPLDYEIAVSYEGVTIEAVFTISGIGFHLLNDDLEGAMTVGLSVGSATVKFINYEFIGR